MLPSYHIVISSVVFGALYIFGAPLNFVLLAFSASILVDIDHMALGRFYGTYNPIEIYTRCAARDVEGMSSPKEVLLRRWFDLRAFPFHNLVLNLILLVAVLPIGVGVLLHNVLDAVDYVIFHKMK